MKVHSLALTLGALILAFSVSAQDANKSGEGERKISMTDCNEVKVNGSWRVDVVPSNDSDFVIKGEENILQKLRIQNKKGILVVQAKGLFASEGNGSITIPLKCLPPQNRFTGACKISIQGELKKDTRWTLTQGASLEIEKISARSFSVHANDTCSVTVKRGTLEKGSLNLSKNATANMNGKFNRMDIRTSGSAKADVKTCTDARVSARNNSSIMIDCTKTLNAVCFNAGQVTYSGSPALTQRTSGSGSILKK